MSAAVSHRDPVAVSTGALAATYVRVTRGRSASRCILLPSGCLPRVTFRRSTVDDMEPCDSQEWRQLLADWQEQTDLFLSTTDSRREHRHAALAWWATTARILRETQSRLAAGRQMDPLPDDVLKVLEGMSEYLAVGIVPGPITAVKGRGKPPIGPTEARDISWATAYMTLCADGIITDPAYVATVSRHYDVARQTAQTWKARTIVPAVAIHMGDPALIEAGMRNAGNLYRASQARRKLGKAPV